MDCRCDGCGCTVSAVAAFDCVLSQELETKTHSVFLVQSATWAYLRNRFADLSALASTAYATSKYGPARHPRCKTTELESLS